MLSFVTINFNDAEATLGLLRSLEHQTDNDFSVTVVDNASTPEDRARLGEYAASSPLNLDLILSDSNRGFSGGNNLAARKLLELGSQWLVFINNDTTVPTDFAATLRRGLRDREGIVGIPLREGSRESGIGSRVAYGGRVRWFKSTLPHLYHYPLPTTHYPLSLYAIGAGVAVHRDAFRRLGLWDERYFLYFEDADLSMRAHERNIPVSFLDTPVIDHIGSRTTSRLGSPLLLRYHARNALLFNTIHGPWWVRALLPLASIYGIVFQLSKILLMPSKRAPSRAILHGILDFYGKRFGRITEHPTHRHRM